MNEKIYKVLVLRFQLKQYDHNILYAYLYQLSQKHSH
jgi:hypothetical protein